MARRLLLLLTSLALAAAASAQERAPPPAPGDAPADPQGESLLLRSPIGISREAIANGLSDLLDLPAAALERLGDGSRWLSVPGHRGSLLLLLAALVPLGLLLHLLRAWMSRRIDRLGARRLEELPVRTALLVAHLARSACFAAFLWIAPRLAIALVHGLPPSGGELLRGLGNLLALFWMGLALNRELLRPRPPGRMVLAVDAPTARRVGAAVKFQLWFSLAALTLQLSLTRLDYGNAGAIEAIDLAHKIVAGAVVLLLLLQRSLLASLLPEPSRPVGRLLLRMAALLRPVLVLLVPTVLVLEALGYRILASFVTRLGLAVVAAFPLGSIAYHAIAFLLVQWRDRALARSEGEPEAAARIQALDRIGRSLLRVAIVAGLAAAVLAVTGTSPAGVRRSLEFPLPLQDVADPALAVTWWNVAAALLLIVVFVLGSRQLKLALAAIVLPGTRLARSTQYSITTLTVYAVMGLGLWLSISQIVDIRSLGYLVAALSVGIGFGLQEIVSNFMSGLILLFERPIKPGDLVEIGGGTFGTVRELGIRATTLRTNDNIHILVPNREFITQKVVNYDHVDPKIRISVNVGVAYGSDPKMVRDVLVEVAAKDGRILKRPAPDVHFQAFGDSSLDFRLMCWIDAADQQWRIASDLRFAIDAAFKRHAISIPFPQRDVALRADAPLRVIVDRGAAPPTDAPVTG